MNGWICGRFIVYTIQWNQIEYISLPHLFIFYFLSSVLFYPVTAFPGGLTAGYEKDTVPWLLPINIPSENCTGGELPTLKNCWSPCRNSYF